jgi:hypothetical protein
MKDDVKTPDEVLVRLEKRLDDVERHLDHHDAVDDIRRRGRIERQRQTADRLYGAGIALYAVIVVACFFPEQTARVLSRMASWRFDA